MQLHEQYRPSAWSDVVGQDKILARIEAIRQRGLAGRAYWISGPCSSPSKPARCCRDRLEKCKESSLPENHFSTAHRITTYDDRKP
jgi:hypothetical protein